MTMFHFGDSAADFVEIPDATYAAPEASPDAQLMVRPAAGTAFQVRDVESHLFPTEVTDLGGNVLASTDMVSLDYGYVAFTASSPIVEVSADAGTTWKTLYGREALSDAVNAGVDVTALTDRVTELELNGGGGGGSGATGYAGAAPGTILVWPLPDQAGQLLTRPTTRTDVIIEWCLDTPPPEGLGYYIPGVDRFLDTSP